jgi:hypothetical protein
MHIFSLLALFMIYGSLVIKCELGIHCGTMISM